MDLTLDSLIRNVKGQSDQPLHQLDAASQTATELGDLGDSLLNHFVDICRRSGHSWAEIGQHLGVTRQAVQQRFPDFDSIASFGFERYTTRARVVLERSPQVAAELGHNYVGGEHILIALFDNEEGLAAKALDQLGVKRTVVLERVLERAPRGEHPTSPPLPFTPRARVALQSTVSVAIELGHNYVGTEHILLGLYHGQDGLASTILNDLGADRDRAKAKVIELLSGYLAARQQVAEGPDKKS